MANTYIGPDGFEYSATVPGQDPRSMGMPTGGMPTYGMGYPTDSRSAVQQMLRNMAQNRQQQRVDTAIGQTQSAISAANRVGGLGGFGNPAKTAAIDARRRAMNVNAPGIPRFMRDQMDAMEAKRQSVAQGLAPTQRSDTPMYAPAPSPEVGGMGEQTSPRTITVETGEVNDDGTPEIVEIPVVDETPSQTNPIPSLPFYNMGRSGPEDAPAQTSPLPANDSGSLQGTNDFFIARRPTQTPYQMENDYQTRRVKNWLRTASLPELQQYQSDPNYRQEVLDSLGFNPNLAEEYFGSSGEPFSAVNRLLTLVPDSLKTNLADVELPVGNRIGPAQTTTLRDVGNAIAVGVNGEPLYEDVDPSLQAANQRYEQQLQQDIYQGQRSNNPVDQLRGIEAQLVLARRAQQEAQSQLNTSLVQDNRALQFFNRVGEYFGGPPSIDSRQAFDIRGRLDAAGNEIGTLESRRRMLTQQFPGLNTQGMTPSEYMTMMDDRFAGPNESQIAADQAYDARVAELAAIDNELARQREVTAQLPLSDPASYLYTDPMTGASMDVRKQPNPRNYADEDNFLTAPAFGTGILSPEDLAMKNAAMQRYNDELIRKHAEFNNYAIYGTGPDVRGYNDPLYTPGLAPGIPASLPRVPLNYLPAPPVPPMYGPTFNPRIPVMRAAPGGY